MLNVNVGPMRGAVEISKLRSVTKDSGCGLSALVLSGPQMGTLAFRVYCHPCCCQCGPVPAALEEIWEKLKLPEQNPLAAPPPQLMGGEGVAQKRFVKTSSYIIGVDGVSGVVLKALSCGKKTVAVTYQLPDPETVTYSFFCKKREAAQTVQAIKTAGLIQVGPPVNNADAVSELSQADELEGQS